MWRLFWNFLRIDSITILFDRVFKGFERNYEINFKDHKRHGSLFLQLIFCFLKDERFYLEDQP